MKQSGIEPATFRFVAQHLNHCATAVPLRYKKLDIFSSNSYNGTPTLECNAATRRHLKTKACVSISIYSLCNRQGSRQSLVKCRGERPEEHL